MEEVEIKEMNKEIGLDQAIFKTIAGYEYSTNSSQMVIVFNDETFTTLGIHDGDIGSDKLNIDSFGDDYLVRSGIATQEELDHIRKEKEKIRKKNKEDIYL